MRAISSISIAIGIAIILGVAFIAGLFLPNLARGQGQRAPQKSVAIARQA
jgi:hypothetical protein